MSSQEFLIARFSMRDQEAPLPPLPTPGTTNIMPRNAAEADEALVNLFFTAKR
jgi:hypothetical protein